ncbi:hypothetical protein CERZMDRAFT_116608 [Cercospora zeae-maydis SCOH1-5]|uniref:Uncharacterized protein n=1 Tax=Cercospora zeae-maydis SCOH1-5 TaxID=717836 RepID=A0A6A6FR54_9PEZI|nr:hypothetical protein CERZMDRAFT_116608 [Cercospora zeae-maydis SCOH1-5]
MILDTHVSYFCRITNRLAVPRSFASLEGICSLAQKRRREPPLTYAFVFNSGVQAEGHPAHLVISDVCDACSYALGRRVVAKARRSRCVGDHVSNILWRSYALLYASHDSLRSCERDFMNLSSLTEAVLLVERLRKRAISSMPRIVSAGKSKCKTIRGRKKMEGLHLHRSRHRSNPNHLVIVRRGWMMILTGYSFVQRPAVDLDGILVGAGLDLADEAEEKTSLLLAGLAGLGELLREALEALINLSRKAPSQLWSEAVVVAPEDDMANDASSGLFDSVTDFKGARMGLIYGADSKGADGLRDGVAREGGEGSRSVSRMPTGLKPCARMQAQSHRAQEAAGGSAAWATRAKRAELVKAAREKVSRVRAVGKNHLFLPAATNDKARCLPPCTGLIIGPAMLISDGGELATFHRCREGMLSSCWKDLPITYCRLPSLFELTRRHMARSFHHALRGNTPDAGIVAVGLQERNTDEILQRQRFTTGDGAQKHRDEQARPHCIPARHLCALHLTLRMMPSRSLQTQTLQAQLPVAREDRTCGRESTLLLRR